MADIALRDYDYEIEAMLDAGEFDDAIAHCLNILRAYPKHLQAYHLMARGLVKTGRYKEAIPLLKRLLSALPDEFDAHQMLSNIYVESGNLEAGLWHAKRAFEIKPTEKEVQKRLRDLFTQRDGKAPPMRLTRGALARMYVNQPDQTEQAITEIRSILLEKPDRVELQVLLAQILHSIHQDEEAAQVCISVLEVLPHSLEANCILAEIYDASKQSEQAEIHWARIKELDPYDKRLEKRMLARQNGTLTDNNVIFVIEHVPPSVFLPGWEDNLGIRPSPLVAVSAEFADGKSDAAPVETVTAMDDVAEDENDLLAWLNETPPGPADTIGSWLDNIESSSSASEGQLSLEPADAQEIEQNSYPLPDWLYNLAKPKTGDDIQQSIDEVIKSKTDEWLPEIEQSQAEILSSQPEAPEEESTEELPDWLKNLDDLTANLSDEADREQGRAEEEARDWSLSADTADEPAGEGMEPVAAEPSGGLPDWLEGLGEEGQEQEPLSTAEIGEPGGSLEAMDMIDLLSRQEPTPAEEIPSVPPSQADYHPIEQLPDWLKSLEDTPERGAEAFLVQEEEPQGEIQEVEFEFSEAEIQEILQESGEEAAPTSEEYRPVEQLPDWLKELGSIEPAIAREEMETPEEAGVPPPDVDLSLLFEPQARKEEIPDWLADITWAEKTGEQIPEGAASETVEASEWSIEVEAEGEEGKPEAEFVQPVPEWMVDKDIIAEVTGEEPPPEGKPKAFGPGPEWHTDLEKMIESAERLALEQEMASKTAQPEQALKADQDIGTVKPAEGIPMERDAAKKVPDWLMEEEAPKSLAAQKEAGEIEEAEEPLPDWTAEVEKASESFEAMIDNILREEAPQKESEGVTPTEAKEKGEQTGEMPDWMHEIMIESMPVEASEEPEEPQTTESIPDWLKHVSEGSTEETEAEAQELVVMEEGEEQPQFENINAAIDWLENVTENAAAGGAEAGLEVSEGEPAAEEALPSFEITEGELAESTIELTSQHEPMPSVSSAWVLESIAGPQELQRAVVVEESIPAHQAININKAGLGDLEQLPHVGFRLAQNIINYRQFHGEFRTLDDLRNVPKMDASILDEIASYIQFEDMPIYAENAVYRGGDLTQAKSALERGDLAVFLAAYSKQISQRQNLPEVIGDLLQVAKRYPDDLSVWQTLGDAYLQAGNLDEALDSYRKAEEILQ